jgi:initiation factor 1A
MVKNTKGGGNNKRLGRKFLNGNSGGNRAIREVEDDDEMYAAVTKIFGNGMCDVMCNDGTSRLCIIRNKFRGRGKRDNVVAVGVWLMVGIRSWESITAGKPQKCDLLEVYTDNEKTKLKKNNSIHLAKLIPDIMIGNVVTDDLLEFSNAENVATFEIDQEMDNDEDVVNKFADIVVSNDGCIVSIDDI